MAYHGDIPANLSLEARNSVVRNNANSAFIGKNLDEKNYILTIDTPSSTQTIVMCYVYEASTFFSLSAIKVGGTSITIKLYDQSTPYTGTDTISTLAIITDEVTSDSFTYAVTAGHWLTIKVDSISGTVNSLIIIAKAYTT